MIGNKDSAILYADRAVFNKNGVYAGVVVGWNDMHGVIPGIDHGGLAIMGRKRYMRVR